MTSASAAWALSDGVYELRLDQAPCNEIGLGMLETLVSERLEEAQQMVAKGTAPSAVYDTLMASAKTEVED